MNIDFPFSPFNRAGRTGRSARRTSGRKPTRRRSLHVESLEGRRLLAVAPPIITFGTGVPDGATLAEATQVSGLLQVQTQAGNRVSVTLYGQMQQGNTTVVDSSTFVTRNYVATSSAAVPVQLTPAEVTQTLKDGIRYATVWVTDPSGNSNYAVSSFTIDTTPPPVPRITLGSGVLAGATLAEATQPSGLLQVAAEAGARVTVQLYGLTALGAVDSTTLVQKELVGAGALSLPVALTASDVEKLRDGLRYASVWVIDSAGNAVFGTQTFTIDTTPPPVPRIALGSGVLAGATLAEATQPSGLLQVAAEAGARVTVQLYGLTALGAVDSTTLVQKELVGAGATWLPVALTASDVGKLRDGLRYASVWVTDSAGNAVFGTQTFTIDTVAPKPPVITLGAGVADGATAPEATQSGGILRVQAEPGATVQVQFVGRTAAGANDPNRIVTKVFANVGSAAFPVSLTGDDVLTLRASPVAASVYVIDPAGNASNAVQLLTIVPTLPAAVSTPTVMATRDRELTLSWNQPAEPTTAPVTAYIVQVAISMGRWLTAGTFSTTTANFTGLENGRTYSYRIAAVTADGAGPWSAVSGGAPRAVPQVVTGLVATPADGAATLTWSAPPPSSGLATTDYLIDYSVNGGLSWTRFNDGVTPVTRSTVTGLDNGTPYVFRVAAVNSAATGSWTTPSASVVPRTVPGAATDLTATAGESLVTLAWNPPLSNGGETVTGYIIYYRVDNSVDNRLWTRFGETSALTATVTGLTNGTSYYFSVSAKNAAGQGVAATTPQPVMPRTKPGVVGDITVSLNLLSNLSEAKVDLLWSPPWSGGTAVTDYVIQYSANDGASWTTFAEGGSDQPRATVTGLAYGTAYRFQIAAVNSVGTGLWSAASAAFSPPFVFPGAPTNVTAIPLDGCVRLSWSAPQVNGGSVLGYEIQASFDGGATWASVGKSYELGATSREATIQNLKNGSNYRFRMAASNGWGKGSWSESTLPVTPTNIAVNNVRAIPGNAIVRLSWSPPAVSGGLPINDYAIQYSSDNGSTWTSFSPPDWRPDATPSRDVYWLPNGVQYVFRVKPSVSGVWGTWSANTAPVVPSAAAPQPPRILTADAGNGAVLVSWEPTSGIGNGVMIYDLEYRPSSSSTWTKASSAGAVYAGSGTSTTVTGLDNGIPYVLRMRATNAQGTGEWSPISPPFLPTNLLPGRPVALTSVSGNGTVNLSWTRPSETSLAPITDYLVQHSADGRSWTPFQDGVSAAASATVTGLVNGRSYQLRVAAANATGQGLWSDPIFASPAWTPPLAAPPGVVTNLSATPYPGAIALSWSAPSEANSYSIRDYLVQYSTNAGLSWFTYSDGESTSTTATVRDLNGNSRYMFRIAAVNSVGPGNWSAATQQVTFINNPDVVTNLTASAGNGLVNLSWSAPADTGGNQVTNYVVQYSSNAGSSWIDFPRSPSSATSVVVAPLVNNVPYVFRVAATTVVGTGAWTVSGTVTPTQPPAPGSRPGEPRNVSARPVNGSMRLSWLAPASSSSEFLSYRIQSSTNGGDWVDEAVNPGAATSVTVAGLKNGWYVYRVAAVNAYGRGEFSPASVEAMVTDEPGAPTNLSATRTASLIRLSWLKPEDEGRASLRSYQVEYMSLNDEADVFATNQYLGWSQYGTTSIESIEIVGLDANTSYTFRVTAMNDYGFGVTSSPAEIAPALAADSTRRFLQVGASVGTFSARADAFGADLRVDSNNSGFIDKFFDNKAEDDLSAMRMFLGNRYQMLFSIGADRDEIDGITLDYDSTKLNVDGFPAGVTQAASAFQSVGGKIEGSTTIRGTALAEYLSITLRVTLKNAPGFEDVVYVRVCRPEIVIGIDGTSQDAWLATGKGSRKTVADDGTNAELTLQSSHVKNLLQDAERAGATIMYDVGITKVDEKFASRMSEIVFLLERRLKKVFGTNGSEDRVPSMLTRDIKIGIVGWSRGGWIALVLANRIAEFTKVQYVGAYDPVNMSRSDLGATNPVVVSVGVENVRIVAAASRFLNASGAPWGTTHTNVDYASHRGQYPYINLYNAAFYRAAYRVSSSAGGNLQINELDASHGAIGGVPGWNPLLWDGDRAYFVDEEGVVVRRFVYDYGKDVDASVSADRNIREGFGSAGFQSIKTHDKMWYNFPTMRPSDSEVGITSSWNVEVPVVTLAESSSSSVWLRWVGITDASGFSVQYRLFKADNSEQWVAFDPNSLNTTENGFYYATVSGLLPNRQYEFRIGGRRSGVIAYSQPYRASTLG